MVVGIIGGSGLYQLSEGGGEQIRIDTPFGSPSGPYIREKVGGNTVLFLPRHGTGHSISPSEINYRANIYGFKELGAQALVSLSAVGSMKEEIVPGEFVLPDQYIDCTKSFRANTFFGGGVVGHVPFADPACGSLREHLSATCRGLSIRCHVGGTYVCIEGPQFSTRAESHLYRSWDLPHGPVSVIGMTAMPEARLAREAGLCYHTVAMATDYDCWNEEKGDVSVEAIMHLLHENVATSRRLVSELLAKPFPACRSHCADLMKSAVVTPKEHWPQGRQRELAVILR